MSEPDDMDVPQFTTRDLLEAAGRARKAGAAVAFGLMGMAQEILARYYKCSECGRFAGKHFLLCAADDRGPA
jgi:hypothetical protein